MCDRPVAASCLPSMVIGPKCLRKRGLWAGEQIVRPRTSRRRSDARQSDWIAMLEEGLLPEPVAPLLAEPADAADDDFERPVVHRIVSAAGQPLPTTLGPRSIFELFTLADAAAADVVAEQPLVLTPQAERPLVTRDAGITRCAGAAYPSNRWTPEREEQERQRRARQKPPRPQRQKFKMKGTRQWADQK